MPAASINDLKARSLAFSQRWADACDEAAQAKPFWLDFLEIFGQTDKRLTNFEHQVRRLGERRGYIDLFWPGKLLVEHKSLGKDLDKAMHQAMGYLHGLSNEEMPELVVVCDFARFECRNLQTGDTLSFETRHLYKHVMWFGTLAGFRAQTLKAEDPVNVKAAERMGRLHDALKQSGYQGHELEVLLVRLLFCLFADDTSIFFPAQSFADFVRDDTRADGSDLGSRLAQLFQVLNTPEAQRSHKLDAALAAFPYVNGKLFEEPLPLADFDTAMRQALVEASVLDWSQISPAIFGSLFQSIMNAEARRNLGAHYTSEANILKLIGPLFLDELRAEFKRIEHHRDKLGEFHQRLAQLRFLDPACGCGNFLVICYRELRLLELEVLRAIHNLGHHRGQLSVDVDTLIRVNVHQFHGIEIEEFPAQIAQVALWLVDHQMNLRVSEEFGQTFARIPLVNSPHIVHGNALQVDWATVLPPEQCAHVLGNPPFLGKTYQSPAQKADLARVFHGMHGAGDLDLVCAWYIKAAHYVQAAHAKGLPPPQCAFVSTNSITQGEQVPVLWGEMQRLGMEIRFAHRTFQWNNEASGKAAVHCVIVGFGLPSKQPKTLFEYEDIKGEAHAVSAKQINAYLVDAPTVLIQKRRTPITDVALMVNGSKPTDGGHLILSTQEKDELLELEPAAAPWIKRFTGADEFINRIDRWCLWLVDCPPDQLKAMPHVMKRVQAVQKMRSESNDKNTRADAAMPARFQEVRQPQTNYLLVPSVSSERRAYVPIGFIHSSVIVSNLVYAVPNATPYHFGILTSTMHNAWMRYTCGRLESRYRYSASIVYNNFPWPELASDKHHEAIATAAQAVLDARAKFPDASLADLYDPLTMPPALFKAHQQLDTAVDKAYEPSGGKKEWPNDAARVAFLFELYEKKTSALITSNKPKRKAKSC
ncbi:MAG: hypothetical protein RL111_252 [Pseudomonadota bacterium]